MQMTVRKKRLVLCGAVMLPAAGAVIAWFLPWCRSVAAMPAVPDSLPAAMVYLLIPSRKTWWNGAAGTLKVSFLGTVFGFALAVLLTLQRTVEQSHRDPAFLKIVKTAGQRLEMLYVAVIRGTPMMVQACIIYYSGFAAAKALMPGAPVTEINRAWSFFTAALITVSLNTAAYLAEVLRGGVEALDKGQKEAALSLGFTRRQTMCCVVLPQAIRNSLPAIGNELINNVKGTSVLNVIGFVELMFATGTVAGFYYQYLASYCDAALIYLALTLSLTKLLYFIMRKAGLTVS